MSAIVDVLAREILDSRGNPTVECDIVLETGVVARASVPSGASTGSAEAVELRDGGNRFFGKGVQNAVSNIKNEIFETIVGFDVRDQLEIDKKLVELDGTAKKSRLGANSVLAVSLAVAKAGAADARMPLYRYLGGISAKNLPVPMMNIINGGAHANNNLDIQEFMIVPAGFETFSESLRCGCEIFQSLREILKHKNLSCAVGDEGGFAPAVASHFEALDLILEAIEKAGYKPKSQVALALDCASSEFYIDGKYELKAEKNNLSPDEFVSFLSSLCKKYPIISVEDGASEDDWITWEKLTASLGSKIQLVGDDLFVTDTQLLKRGIDQKIANSILIKVNQIGTLSESFAAVALAKANGFTSVVSHRSGETEDTSIADIAVGVDACQIKTGSLSRTDRVSKYNQLLRIEEDLGPCAHFPGFDAFKNRGF
ncbi:MAG: phosphopyruvate hydratase [Betaproteobacteria bacterium TMED82]|nr:MAG: phosphopyruvate hydratase [Betaproteobacteria bacterium TMED82]|tara:strand:+ start:2699 stop:3982 length:1284 start_codon:yes stop_codon:yes gene_type:complete